MDDAARGTEGSIGRVLRLDLEFDGTEFLGWQRQACGRTVQGELEAALERVLGSPHRVVGCGRLDAGAHARCLVASCPTQHAMPAARLARALDAVLPPDLGIRDVREAPPSFHARRDARQKWYRYAILRSRTRRPLLRRTTWHVPGALSQEALDRMGAVLAGRHDFASFSNAGSPRRSTVRTLYDVRWTPSDECLVLDVVGDGFLYKMVRTLVGTMVGLARPAGEPDTAARDLEAVLAARDRRRAGKAAPARGLCLMAVVMAGEDPAALGLPFSRQGVESARRRSGGRS